LEDSLRLPMQCWHRVQSDMVLIDTHAHIYLPEFASDIGQVIQNATASHVTKILLPNIDTSSTGPMLDICSRFPLQCHPMIGLHPTSVGRNYREHLEFLELTASNREFTAIGETGLDAYWDTTFMKEQTDSFLTHLEWAKKLDIPVVIHSRQTMDAIVEIIASHKGNGLRGVFHAFSGTVAQALKIVSLGFKLGIGGVVTYKNSGLLHVIETLSLENFVLETDSPYLTPVPKRGKRNEPANVLLIAGKIAEIKKITVEEVASATSKTAANLFNLIPG
jgi:TatD DNase family protein